MDKKDFEIGIDAAKDRLAHKIADEMAIRNDLKEIRAEIQSLQKFIEELTSRYGDAENHESDAEPDAEEQKEPVKVPYGSIKKNIISALRKIPLGEFDIGRVKEIIYTEYPEYEALTTRINASYGKIVRALAEEGYFIRTAKMNGLAVIWDKVEHLPEQEDN